MSEQRQCQWCTRPGSHSLTAHLVRWETGESQLVQFWACDDCAAKLLKRRSIHDPAARHCLCRQCLAEAFDKWEKVYSAAPDDAA